MKTSERFPWLSSAITALVLLTFVGRDQAASAADFAINGQRFTVPDGFVVELAAGTNLVQRPVSASFAADGRLYVTDSSGSNDKPDQQLKNPTHRILCLEDTNGDGRFDTVKVFADKVMFPQGCLWYEGSVYVAAPPSIWKFTDTDGDGVADKREEWFKGGTLTGCANDIHGPFLGPDGYLYWTKGAFSEQTHTLGNGRVLKDRAAHIYRAKPDGSDLDVIMTGGMDNPVEVAFTREGEAIFTSTFIDFSQPGYRDGIGHAIYGGVFGKANDALEDGRVKRTGPDLMQPFIQMGAAAPSGLCRSYRASFGVRLWDVFFSTSFNLHKVSQHVLRTNGATYISTDRDVLVSDSQDFHPTDVLEDVDGSLIVVDTGGWYKLCCPSSQLTKPDVLGGIYRLRHSGTRNLSAGDRRNGYWSMAMPPSLPPKDAFYAGKWARHGDEKAEDWILTRLQGILTNGNEWFPKTDVVRVAAEGLGRVGYRPAVPTLLQAISAFRDDELLIRCLTRALLDIGASLETREGLMSSSTATQRAALIALDQMDGSDLKAAEVVPFLSANDERLRTAASWVLSHHPEWGEDLAGWFREQLGAPVSDPARLASLYSQFSILTRAESGQQLLADVVSNRGFKSEARVAALNAMADARLKQAPASWKAAVLQGLGSLTSEAIAAGRTGSETGAPIQLAAIRAARSVNGGTEMTTALNGLADDPRQPVDLRLEALSALPVGSALSGMGFDFVCARFASTNAPMARSFAVSILSRAKLTVSQLSALTDTLKSAGPLELTRLLAVFAVGGDDALGQKLLAALKESKSARSLNPGQIRPQLAKFPETTRKESEEFLASLNADAGKQAARLDSLLAELKSLPGDIRRGQAVFNSSKAACVACHKLGYLGGNVGPDLTSLGAARTERDLLESIVYPSASFVRSYEPMTVATKSGEELSGVLKKDAPDEVVLATGPGVEIRLARNDIIEMRPGTVSVMPQGLDEQLSRQELSDLVTFLKNTKWGPQ